MIPEEQETMIAPWTMSRNIDLPETRTLRELSLIAETRPDLNMGFFAKMGTAFSNETVIGEIIREMRAPEYGATGYIPSAEDREKYASDLDSKVVDRVADASESFPEFLYELDQVRLTNKRRAELFSGGTLGALEGLGLTILAAGGEAVALTLLAGAVGTAIGGPGGGAAASGATVVTRVHRIKSILKAMGTAAAIDIPLETTRYALDKTLRPEDLVIALGASAGLSGAVGAWKPQMFLRELQNMSHTASLRQAAAAAEEAGDKAVAEAVEAQTRQTVKVVPFDDDFDEVMKIPGTKKEAKAAGVEALFDVAKREGVETTRVTESGRRVPRAVQDVRGDLIEARRAQRVTPEAVERQALRDLDGMDTAARRREGRRLGVPQKTLDRGGKTLVNAIVKARKFAADRGFVMVDQMPKMPKGLRLRTSTSIKGVKVTFRGPLEKALWSLHTGKGLEQKKVLSDWFKKAGVENPEELAKEFAEEMRKRAKAAKDAGSDSLTADSSGMRLKSAVRVREDGTLFVPGEGETIFAVKKPISQQVDEDIAGDIPKAKDDPGVHPMEEPETVVTGPDGNPIAVGSSRDLADVEEMALGGDPGKYTVTGHGKGVRETIARAIDVMGDVPGFRFIYKAFAPVTLRLLRSDSELVRHFAAAFLENPRGGGSNVTTRVRVLVDRHLGELGQQMEKAKAAARAEGRKLDDTTITRLLRSGAEAEGPEAIAVNALRKFHADLRKYGIEGGVFTKDFPESATYFHRAWKPSQFAAMIDEFGEEQVTDFIAQAVMNHKNTKASGIDITKARKIARRIVEYGMEPQAARDWRGTKDMVDRMRKEITEEFLSDARRAGQEISESAVEREVDDFIEAVIPSIDNQPHLSYGRRRIDLDENFSMTMGGRTVHIDELMNNNILPNVTRYAHKVIGGVEVRKGMKAVFGKEDMTLGDAMKALRTSQRQAGEKVTPESTTFAEDMFSHAYKGLVGQPIYNSPQFMKWAMGSNAFAQATIGMTLGFAQIPEIASIVARTGFRAALQQIPGLKETANIFTMGIRDLATGRQGLGLSQLRDDFTACLETFTGVAGDYRRGDHFMRRLDDMGIDDDYLQGGALKFLEYGRQVAALNPLGVMPMDTFLRRWAVRSSFQHFVNEAYRIGPNGKAALNDGWWKNSKVRFEQLGMTGEDLERLSVALRDPDLVTTEPGLFGRYTVKGLDLSKVKDQAIIDKFALALRRHSDHMVQRQSFGETPYWVNTAVGKMIAQYRVFALASKSKQLAAGVARGDAHEAINFVGAGGLGILAYQAQSYYRAIGMEERERSKYLKNKFTSENLIKAGVLRGSYSSIFPALIDSGAWTVTGSGVFDESMRTTGLGVDPLLGSVPGNVIYKKAWPAFRELSGFAFRGDSMSQQDLRHLQSLIWATKMPGLDQTINRFFINQFPKQD